MSVRVWPSLVLLAAVSVAVGCDEPVSVGGPPPGQPAPGQPAPVQPAPQAPAPGEDAGSDEEEAGPLFSDDDFVESAAARDPFRSHADMFTVKAVERPQRTVIMPTTGIDEMRLIAIISGVARPRAMLVDSLGVGHVVERGDYLGRAEVVQTGGAEGMPVTLNWRVDRIRENELVLTREDPTAPNQPPLSRVIALREEEPVSLLDR